jgi:hypothetical protein
MSDLPEFNTFPSIPRLFRPCVVTEKIDGTNSSVHVLEDGRVLAGSRNRYITEAADNFGFAKWVKAHETELKEGLGVGQHFGEWFGSGIQRGYGFLNGEKRFALFNRYRWAEIRPSCCEVIPLLYEGPLDTERIRSVAADLLQFGSRVAPGFNRPEGIVVYHTKSKQSYKFTFEKNDGHKSAD